MSLKVVVAIAVLWSTACEATIGGSATGGGGGTDASITPTPDGPGGTVTPDASSDAPRCSARVIYLNFEGVTLTRATPSDSTADRASWIGVTTATVPRYRTGAADRATQIQAITTRITTALSGIGVMVTTVRPLAGQYVMVVFGGTETTVGSQYSFATSFHDCGDLVKNDVAWVSDQVSSSKVGDFALGAIGWGLGLNGTNSPNDCMCGWSNTCDQLSTPCTLSPSITTTGALSPETACPNLATQNEVGVFTTAFCQ
ncbi:MAG: hypothetical protein H0X17_08265 [Deltaproteobacteria bacterium]|nr:hypothetical protein [Deltaproteobacteria bacterium]